jgi:pyrroloquinoline quinone (PQQ) biosynthesis protein C
MGFFNELIAATSVERARLQALPIIRDTLAGRVTLPEYRRFLGEAYHHVKHTVPLLMACGARLPERLGWLRAAVAEYIEEEIGHDEWILDDIRACGGDAESVRNGQPSAATELMVAYAYDTIARVHPAGFFGMVLVLEGTSTALALNAAAALKQHLGLDARSLRYLTSHGQLDQQHIGFYEGLMDRLEDPDDRAAVIHAARMFYALYGQVFESIRTSAPKLAEAA